MATIVLSAVGSSVGASTGLPFGATLGRMLGASLGASLEGGTHTEREGPRLETLSVQTSSYGKVIPQVAGRMRLGGNVVWCRPLREVASVTTTRSGGKGGGGGRASSTSTTYSYFASCAVMVCEGPVDAIDRIWADTKLLDPSLYTIRTYFGGEGQMPDPLIESFEGVGTAPAYRGLAYVMFEDFPLADFGNRLPNFTFEVRRTRQLPEIEGQPLEQHIKAVTLIPGSGEWVYDTIPDTKRDGAWVGVRFVPGGYQEVINCHARSDQTDAVVALDQLQATLPNVEWVSVVVSWFGTSLDAASCTFVPGVEYRTGGSTFPEPWGVAGYDRTTARLITYVGDGPQYGGTPSDNSLLRLLDHLRARGLKVALYPLPMMDLSGKPWRGHITGSASAVADIFTRTNGYNHFVRHYANLCAGRVDAFIIGSELKGLTSVSSSAGVYPAVDQLVALAAEMRGILGSGVKLTYAADWSEYHHTDGGWYHLDALWASSNIDAVGIDAYFPLTDSAEDATDEEAALAGWTSGEHYDYYYTDSARTTRASLSPAYALKNISWWWNNHHTQPNGATSAWSPASKPIWFTEIGYPSVDGAANQPNVFYDPASSDGGLPRHSRGAVDMRAQRVGLLSALRQWHGSGMVERMFFWTWDARPYPHWPDRTDVWSDGPLWAHGHWLQGKLGVGHLGALVLDLCRKAGLPDGSVDASALNVPVDGFILNEAQSVRQAIESLQAAYFFDLIESGTTLRAQWRRDAPQLTLSPETLLRIGNEEANATAPVLQTERTQALELPSQVEVQYLSRSRAYDASIQRASVPYTALAGSTAATLSVGLPVSLSDAQAAQVARATLAQAWAQRTHATLHLPLVGAAMLEPGDRLVLEGQGHDLHLRVTRIQLLSGGRLAVEALEEDAGLYPLGIIGETQAPPVAALPAAAGTDLVMLDLPALPGDGTQDLTLAAAMHAQARGWRGAEWFRERAGGQSPLSLGSSSTESVLGSAVDALAPARACVMDMASSVTILLRGGTSLHSVSDEALLAGANSAMLGGEVIQFGSVEPLPNGYFRLRRLLRGRLGTEDAIPTHAAGEDFVLLDGNLLRVPLALSLIGLPQEYRAVAFGSLLEDAPAESFTSRGRALLPYAPVHLRARLQSSGEIRLRWLRRTRLGGEWRDGVDAPLMEEQERYRLELLSGSTLLRRWEPTTPDIAYTAAEQLSDFGAPPASLSLSLCQLSSLVGPGIERAAIVPVLPEGFA